MIFEVRDGSGLIASGGDCASAPLLAREWLREPAQRHAGTHTCVLQTRDAESRVIADHIIALSDGPLG